MNTVDPEGESAPPTDEEIQCSLEEGRRQWNADAKAREAIAAFREKAALLGENHLQNREFGALICEFSGGQVALGPISAGDPILDADGNAISYPGGRPTVDIPTDGCGSGTPIGFVHSHPGLNVGVPSDDDFAYAQWHVTYNDAPDTSGIYTVTSVQNPTTGQYADRVTRAPLSDRSAANGTDYQPQWVDPTARPCPGDS